METQSNSHSANGAGPAAASGTENQLPPSDAATKVFATVRSWGLVRGDDRWLAGVCGAVAQRFSIDPLVTRGLAILVTLLTGGVALIVYSLAWAFLPRYKDGQIHAENWLGRNPGQSRENTVTVLWVTLGIVVLVALASGGLQPRPLFFLGADVGFARGVGVLLTVGLLAAVAYGLVQLTQRNQESGGMPAHSGAHSYAGETKYGSYTGSATYNVPTSPAAASTVGASPTLAPPAPRKPRVASAGSRYFAVVGGLSLMLLAGLSLAERTGNLNVPVLGAWAAGSFILLGLGIVVAGLRGRTSGVLGGLAGMLAVPVLLVSLFAGGFMWHKDVAVTVATEDQITVTTLPDAERGYGVVAGTLTVDLRGLELTGGQQVEVPLNVVAGELIVLVDPQVPTVLNFQVNAGSLEVDTATQSIDRGGLRITDSSVLITQASASASQPQITINLRSTAASVVVKDR